MVKEYIPLIMVGRERFANIGQVTYYPDLTDGISPTNPQISEANENLSLRSTPQRIFQQLGTNLGDKGLPSFVVDKNLSDLALFVTTDLPRIIPETSLVGFGYSETTYGQPRVWTTVLWPSMLTLDSEEQNKLLEKGQEQFTDTVALPNITSGVRMHFDYISRHNEADTPEETFSRAMEARGATMIGYLAMQDINQNNDESQNANNRTPGQKLQVSLTEGIPRDERALNGVYTCTNGKRDVYDHHVVLAHVMHEHGFPIWIHMYALPEITHPKIVIENLVEVEGTFEGKERYDWMTDSKMFKKLSGRLHGEQTVIEDAPWSQEVDEKLKEIGRLRLSRYLTGRKMQSEPTELSEALLEAVTAFVEWKLARPYIPKAQRW